ncbi:MAG: FadR/GntR family transcriptional regulator [Gulosibacter sp.]|uniref:FadR/GntR family transcriptional regulator n=1 Tax=Gulosibacter sp. TaxID=2817531 RepID=UPI003F924182
MRKPFSFVPAAPGHRDPFGYGDVLADQIVSAISLGSISVGERLPSEIELAAEFGVAVATLRKSLAILREHGIVETRRGRGGGTFVVSVPFPSEDEIRTYLARLTIVQIRDYGDEHMAIATGIARLACQRSYEQSIIELRHAADRILVAQTFAACSSADSRFHQQLAITSQSPRLLRNEMRLQSEILALKWSPAAAAASREETHKECLEIVDAIEARDAARAEQAIASSIKGTVYRLIDVKLTLDTIDQQ